jgi:predicted nucleic acid-binding protein
VTVVVDTNALISAVTDRDPRQRARAEALLRSAAAGEIRVVIPQCVLFELLFVLENVYQQTTATVHRIIVDLVAMPGVTIVDDIDLSLWLTLWPSQIGGPIDAVVGAVALKMKASVATFDARLARRLARLGVATW